MSEQQSEPMRFKAWANDKGYDTAHTYDTKRSRWVFFNPMTADLWESWCAALSKPSTEQGWISVDERLPGEQGCDSEDVMLFINGHCEITDMECRQGGAWGLRLGYFDAEKQAFRVHGRPEYFVTHWQALPSPPPIEPREEKL